MNGSGQSQTNGSESQQAKTASTTSLPQVIRTKNAESRLAAASPTLNLSASPIPGGQISGGEPLNSVEQHDLEIKKRAEWRQARLASLDAETQRADQLMKQLSAVSFITNNQL